MRGELILHTSSALFYVQSFSKMGENSGPVTTIEDAREVIEEIARRKGTFTDAFRRDAEEEANKGRKGMLQAIEGSDEIRKDLANSLRM